ncbi:hypothetical protein ACOTFG_05175 [Achromobacter xylosoxidans]
MLTASSDMEIVNLGGGPQVEQALRDRNDETYRYVSPEFLPVRPDVCIPVDAFDP